MNIYTNYNIPPIYNAVTGKASAAQESRQSAINQEPAQDVFQKSTAATEQQNTAGVQQSTPVSGIWDNKRIEAIYDKTYETVMAQNPITKELNIKKPVLSFKNSEEKEEDTIASYRDGLGEITVYAGDFFADDIYLCTLIDENNEPANIKIVSKQDINKYKEESSGYKLTTEKLTESEKELYISSVFAHELRHCIQKHLVASTEGCKDEHRKELEDYKKTLEELISLKKELAEVEGKPYLPSKDDEDLEKLNYGLNYKPKKIFDKNTLFKYSMSPSDNRYWSVNEHLHALSNKEKDNYKNNYYNNPLEIDAFNYEREFMLTQADKYPESDLRKEIVDNMFIATSLNVSDADFPFIRSVYKNEV